MRVKRALAVTAASAAVAVGSVAAVGLPAVSAQAATTSVTLSISRYSHMLVDPAHRHIFISSAASSTILVTDYSGQTVATISNEPGADGLALSTDGSTVYAALTTGDAVSAISTSTLAETARYATGDGTDPTYVAYTSGKVWFGYGAETQGGIGSIDPSTSPATVTLNATNDPFAAWYAAPMVTASANGELVAGSPPGYSPVTLASYDVSSGAATVLAPPRFIDPPTYSSVASNLGSMQITPDGADVVVANGAPYYHQIFQVSDLSAVGQYPTTAYPNSVSIASDGTVAAGVLDGSPEVSLFAPGGSTPIRTYNFGSYQVLAADGLAVTPDVSELFAITNSSVNFNAHPVLNIVSNPVLGPSTLSVTGPATDNKDQPITLTGALGGASPYTGGQTLHVTRIDPTNPNGVALPDANTAADGSFTITDTPPRPTSTVPRSPTRCLTRVTLTSRPPARASR
jgi:hypothetical protein